MANGSPHSMVQKNLQVIWFITSIILQFFLVEWNSVIFCLIFSSFFSILTIVSKSTDNAINIGIDCVYCLRSQNITESQYFFLLFFFLSKDKKRFAHNMLTCTHMSSLVSRLWVFRPHSMCNAAPNVLVCLFDANRISNNLFKFEKFANSKHDTIVSRAHAHTK